MLIFIYWCPNMDGDCKIREQVYIKKEDDDKEKEYCESCGCEMKLMGQKTYGGVARFKSLSVEDKRKLLKKRSKLHNKKSGVDDLKNGIDSLFKEQIRDKFGISNKKLK